MEGLRTLLKTRGFNIALGILVVAGGAAYLTFKSKQSPEHIHPETTYAEDFFVTYLDFGQVGQDYVMVINFSQPVDATKLADYFEIIPSQKGTFARGNSDTEVRFAPEIPFQSGLNYSVKINSGLISTLGNELQEEFFKVIALNFNPDDFKILKNDKFSLLQSLPLDNHDSLRVQIGSAITNPSIKIYKTTDPELVIREIISIVAPTYDSNKAEYKTDVSKLTMVSTLEKVTHNSQIPLPKAVGIYLVQAFQNDQLASQVWVTVNTIGVHFRQDDQKFILAAQDLRSGNSIQNVELTTYQVEDQNVTALEKMAFSGLASFPLEYPNRIDMAVAKKGQEYAYIPVNLPGSLAEIGVFQNLSKSWQNFLYTDRPIYKPNDVIKFRGMMRRDNDGQYVLPPAGTKVTVTLGSYQPNDTVLDIELDVNQYGVYFGEFVFSGKSAGEYYVEATTGGNYLGRAWFEILEYKKPPFELSVDVDREEYIEGDNIQVKLKGSNFNGQPFGKQRVTYKIYRLDFYETERAVYNEAFNIVGWGGMCGGGFSPFETYYGEIITEEGQELNDAGELQVSFDTRRLEKNVSQQITFVVEKQDQNGNTVTDAQTAVVHNGDLNIFVRPFKNQTKNAPAPVATFSAEKLSGEKLISRDFDYSIDQLRWDYLDGRYQPIKKNLHTGRVKSNSEGIGQFKVEGFDKMESGFDSIEVTVSTTDGRGNRVSGVQNLYVYADGNPYAAPTLLTVSSPESNLTVGSKATMKIIAPAAMKVLLAFERGRVYEAQWLDLKAGENTYTFDVTDVYMPSITPTFSGFYNNQYYSEGLTFNVPAMKKLQNITVTTDKQQYASGEIAKVSIKVTDSAGRPQQTSLSLGIIDKAIFALRKSTTLPLHSSFYFFRPRRTNNSSSMTGVSFGNIAERGGGGAGGTSILGKDVDVLYWNPDLVTNANGEVTLEMPVTGNTVWKGMIYSSSAATDLGQNDFEFSSR